MTVYVFSGPTLGGEPRGELDAVYLPPVSQGDVYRVTLKQPRAIGIIDGRFHDVPAVWHKEILWALTQGIPVYGSASMGALRAAELAQFGMTGVGWVFESYVDGSLEDDDEVAVAHAGQEDSYRTTSEAMVNIRRTLTSAVVAGVIDVDTGARLADLAKGAFYPLRSYQLMLHLGRQASIPPAQLDALAAWLPGNAVDQKRHDALQMLRLMRDDLEAEARPTVTFEFQHNQFFERVRRSAGELVLDGPAAEADDVTLEHLLDELRLVPELYARTRDRALVRCFALRSTEHGRLDGMPGAVERFRRSRHLYGAAETRDWLSDNHLNLTQFSALVREEDALARAVRAADRLDVHLRSQLRVDGLYPNLVARLREKRRFIRSRGLDDAAASDCGVSDDDILRWYAERHNIMPHDIRGHWQAMDFPDEVGFVRAVRHEYWFATADERGDETTVIEMEGEPK